MVDDKELKDTENQPAEPEKEAKDPGTDGEIHPETDNPDELDPRLFSPLQEADSASPEERIVEVAHQEETQDTGDQAEDSAE
jgi:hypothetical protein